MIKKIDLVDIPAAQEIIRSWSLFFQSKKAQFLWSEDDIQHEIERQESLGSYHQQQLVSLITYQRVAPVLDIRCLATHKDHVGVGHMKNLLSSIFEQHAEIYEIWLEVHEDNAEAKCFYDQIGFEVCGRRPHYYSDQRGAILYRKSRT